jgi:hypothetical protein
MSSEELTLWIEEYKLREKEDKQEQARARGQKDTKKKQSHRKTEAEIEGDRIIRN